MEKISYFILPGIGITLSDRHFQPKYDVVALMDCVCDTYSAYSGVTVTRNEVMTRSRLRDIVECRRMVVFFLAATGNNCNHIADLMCLDHATCIHHVRKTMNYYEVDPHFRGLVHQCRDAIYSLGFSWKIPSFGLKKDGVKLCKAIFQNSQLVGSV